MLRRGPQVIDRLDRIQMQLLRMGERADVLLRRYLASGSRKYSSPRSVKGGPHFLLAIVNASAGAALTRAQAASAMIRALFQFHGNSAARSVIL